MTGLLDRWFGVSAAGSDVSTELRGGLTTFVTMAYIVVVNADILSASGIPFEAAVFATCVAAALGSALMAWWAGYPVALGLVGWEGLLFLGATAFGMRTRVMDTFPRALKLSVGAGIGLFIALIGLQRAGIVVDDPTTLLDLGDLQAPAAALAAAGLVLTGAMVVRGVRGALLWGVLITTGLAGLAGEAGLPDRWLAWPATEVALQLETVPGFATTPVLVVVGALMARSLGDLDWGRRADGLAAFVTTVAVPATCSIGDGLALGVLTWVGVKGLGGEARQVHPVMWTLAVLFLLRYLFLPS